VTFKNKGLSKLSAISSQLKSAGVKILIDKPVVRPTGRAIYFFIRKETTSSSSGLNGFIVLVARARPTTNHEHES
jgi:hypothetical protein